MTGWRFMGGVVMRLMSRAPDRARYRVRGMGVALMVSTSTVALRCLRRSLWATPKRCSSSTTSRPRSLKATSLLSMRWVPTTTSTVPVSRPRVVSFCSLADLKRLKRLTLIG
ncbi:hypothetical protein D3C87_1536150 [compost metagenome]